MFCFKVFVIEVLRLVDVAALDLGTMMTRVNYLRAHTDKELAFQVQVVQAHMGYREALIPNIIKNYPITYIWSC